MGNVIAIGNLKGGTGKSTIAVNLACALAESGDAVVLVDADAQATATDWHAGRSLPVPVESLPLGGERDAQSWVARVLTPQGGRRPRGGRSAAADRLRHRVRPADRRSVRHSGHPVGRRSAGDRQGARSAAAGARGARLVPPACMLVPSRVDRRTAVGRRIHMTLERFGLRVGPAIRQRSAHIEAFDAGAWIGAHAPASPAYREIRVLRDRILELLDETARSSQNQPRALPSFAVAGAPFGSRAIERSPVGSPVS